MSSDFYSDTDRLVKWLHAEDLSGWGSKIEDAIRSGATGTEILMAVRWQCQQMVQAEPVLAGRTRELAESLIFEIEKLLQS